MPELTYPFWLPRLIETILPELPENLATKIQGFLEANTSGVPLVYLAGPMRLDSTFDCGWREKYGPKIAEAGYCVLNTVILEVALHGISYREFQQKQHDLIAQRRFKSFGNLFGPVLELDLALVHTLRRNPMSCIVGYYPTTGPKTTGTDIEFFEAFRLGVPTFIYLDGRRTEVRPFLNAPWAQMYAENKFRAFHSWKTLLEHLKVRLNDSEKGV